MLEWTAYIKIFTTLLAIVNPLGVIPIFVSLTSSLAEQERKRIAHTTTLAVAVVLIVATLLGKPLLNFLVSASPPSRLAAGFFSCSWRSP